MQGHLLVSMVTKSSLATENLECKQQEPVCGCHVWKEASHKGKGGKGGAPAGSPGQKEELLYLKTNFPGVEISPHLFLAHSILNSRSQFTSKMSLLKYFFNFSIFIIEKESTRCECAFHMCSFPI